MNFMCPFLGGFVELTDERRQHIADRHPDLIPLYEDRIATTLADPDQVRQSSRFGGARQFSRWFDDVRGGKHVVVVVVSQREHDRHWIITAYIARRLSGGQVEWMRN